MSVRWSMAMTAVLMLSTVQGVAHHSVAGGFDKHTILKLTGVVARVDWMNQHIYVYFSVKDARGTTAEWRLETLPVAMMRKAGLTKAALLGSGQSATVEIFPARDGTPHLGYMLKITYADGHHYQFDSPESAAG